MIFTHRRLAANSLLAASLLFAFVAVLALPASSAGLVQAQSPPPQQTPALPGQIPATSAVTPEEEAAYRALSALPPGDPKKMIDQGEDFLKKYPTSMYRGPVYSKLAHAYLSADEIDKMAVAGEKALEVNPDDVDVLAIMGWAIPRKLGGNQLDVEQKLVKAEKYCTRAMELLGTLEKPATMTDEAFTRAKNEKLSMCHSGLGVVDFHRQKFPTAVSHFEKATTLAGNPEPTDFFLLGISLTQVNRFPDAVTAFDKCGAVTWVWQQQCKDRMAQAKKQAESAPKP